MCTSRIGKNFESRFGTATSRRVWLSGRLDALLELATKSGKLRRVFVWGSFVTSKPAQKDLDILLIMDEDFEVERIALPSRAVFDSVRAKLLFDRISFGREPPSARKSFISGLETYQTSRDFRKRGIVELELP